MSLHCWGNRIGASYKIPFVKTDGLMLLEAQIDGVQGHLIFDTGADVIVLNRDNSYKTEIFETIDGPVSMSAYDITSLTVGNFTFENLPAYGRDLSQLLNNPQINLLGIIGSGLFNNEVLHIDNENNLIEIYPRKYLDKIEEENYVVSKIQIQDDLIIVPVKISNQEFNFILDTGSSTSFIDAKVVNANSDLFSFSNKSISVKSTSDQKRSSRILSADKVSISNLSIKQLEMGQADLNAISKEMDTQIDGILSLSQLPISEVIIDFEQSLVYFGI